MHRDQALEIFMMTMDEWNALDSKIASALRFSAKTNFVFAEFYGDWAGACATSIWKELQEDKYKWLLKHLGTKSVVQPVRDRAGKIVDRITVKIKTLDTFIAHMMEVETKLWDRFKVHAMWRDSINELYKKQGYIESFMGFREVGYLRRNQICNMPVQGTCFHLLLFATIKMKEWIKSQNLKTKIIGQIHDSIVFMAYIPEIELIKQKAHEFMCELTKQTFSFIGKVPLEVEFEEYPERWSEVKRAA
jgi:hypothetical protein